MKALFKWLAIACVASFLYACGGGDTHYGNMAEEAEKKGFTALLAAVKKAGIASTLSANGANLTLFAPTDAAFNNLAGQIGYPNASAMVLALSAADLTKILQYHLLPGTKFAADLKAGGATQSTAYTFAGTPAKLSLNTANGVAITDAVLATATVTSADGLANNGVIHAIDKVLVPPGVLNVAQMAQANPAVFSTLVSKVVATGLTPTLSGAGPFTVFAPTNAAFTNAATTVASWNTSQLTSVLKYHVLGSQVLSTQIPFGTPVATLNTSNLAGATVPAQTLTINSNLTITDKTSAPASIAATDVRASNGVIHVIGKVLIPE